MERGRNANVWEVMVAAVMLAGLFLPAESPAATFTNLGSIGGDYYSEGYAISADGTTVIGTVYNHDDSIPRYGFIWTAADGMQPVNSFGGYDNIARSISSDGSTIVGQAVWSSDNYYYPFRRTAGGMENLGTLGGTSNLSLDMAYGASADGSVVVGQSVDAENHFHAFRWTDSGMEDLGVLEVGGTFSSAYAVSADGSVVVGESDGVAFRWTAADGMEAIGTLGGYSSVARDISADGTIIVGWSTNSDEVTCLFRWTEEGGMENLGPADPWIDSYCSVSADGSVIVGVAYNEAFIWTEATGILDLASVFEAQGIDLENWLSLMACDVTILPDGSCSIVGYGDSVADCLNRAFLANIEVPVPEPTTMTLLTAGIAAALLRRRKK